MIEPLFNRVSVKIDPVTQEVTRGGIIIPQTGEAAISVRKGTIVAVGPGKKDQPMDPRLKPGVEVLIPAGVYRQFDGLALLFDTDLLGIYTKTGDEPKLEELDVQAEVAAPIPPVPPTSPLLEGLHKPGELVTLGNNKKGR